MIYKKGHSRLACVGVAALFVLTLVACGSPSPTAAPPPPPPATSAPAAPAQPAPTQPPVKETVIVKETVVVQPTAAPATPTTAPTATATAAPTAKPGAVVVPKATSAGKLDATVDFAPSEARSGDNKIQVKVILHITGGAPPFQVKEEGVQQTVTKRADGVEYVRQWQNCGFNFPVTIIITSADGQTFTLATEIPYATYKCG